MGQMPASVTNSIDTALDSDDHIGLREIVDEYKDWMNLSQRELGRMLMKIAKYGFSGRTERYKEVVQAILRKSGQPDVFVLAFLYENASISQLIHQDPSLVEKRDDKGNTLLHVAAERGNLELAALLCNEGAKVNAMNDSFSTPLHLAMHAGPWKPKPANEIAELLREHDATIDLHTSAMLGDRRTIIELLEHKPVDVNCYDKARRTALFYAARNGHEGAAKTLLDYGANPNLACADGQTPLSTACLHMLSQECSQSVVETLISFGASESLESAIVLERLSQIDDAVAREPDLLKGQDHESALGYAIHVWRPKSLRRLIELGAKPSSQNWGHIERIARNQPSLVEELRAI